MSQQINLVPQAVRKKPFSWTSSTTIASTVGIAAAIAMLFAVYQHVRLSQVEAQARSVAKTLEDVRARVDPSAATPRKPDASLEAKLVDLAAQLKARQEVIEALKGGTVGSTAGFSEYFRAFSRQQLEGVWLTGIDIAAGGADLTIVGRALSADLVPQYLGRLNAERPMQGRRVASISIAQPAKGGDPKDTAERALPRYLSFEISSLDSGHPARVGATPQGSATAPSLALRAPLEAEMHGKKAEKAQ